MQFTHAQIMDLGNRKRPEFNLDAVEFNPCEGFDLSELVVKDSDDNQVLSNQPTDKYNPIEAEMEVQPKKIFELPASCKDTVNIIFIGHVDAGKSTIGGQILYSTGMIDERTLEKYEKEAKEKDRESWYLSWALDTNAEEREKGVTVELGRAVFELEHKRVFLLDAPGHKDFIRNMIEGASQADLAVLVISARKGEFEAGFEKGGQTSEHALLVKSSGTQKLIIAVNKMDDPSVNWDKDRYDEIVKKLETNFRKKIGFKPDDLIFLPCSGFRGINIKDPVSPSVCPWYSGKSLLKIIDDWPKINHDYTGPLRISVNDRYKDIGFVIYGKVVTGSFSKSSTLCLMPNKINIKVSGIYDSEDQEMESGYAGQSLRLKVTGIDNESLVQPGCFLCDPQSLCDVSNRFEAQIMILDSQTIITTGFKAMMHMNFSVEEIELIKIVEKIDPKTGASLKSSHTRFVREKDICVARFLLQRDICLFKSEVCPTLSRFSLRSGERTLALGKVLRIGTKS